MTKETECADGEKLKTYRLKNLTVKEATLTPRGANQRAHTLLTKSDTQPVWERVKERVLALFSKSDGMHPMQDGPRTTSDVIHESALWERWFSLRESFEVSCDEILGSDAPNKIELLQRSAMEFVDGLKSMTTYVPETIALSLEKAFEKIQAPTGQAPEAIRDAINKTLDLVESQAKEPAAEEPSGHGDTMKIQAKSLAELLAHLDDADTKAAIQKELDAMKQPAPVAKDAELAQLTKALESERDSRTKLEKALADMQDRQVTAELTTEVRGYELCGLPDAEAVGLLKSLNGQPAAETVRKLFRGATEVSKRASVLTKQFGSAGSELPPDSVAAKVEKEAMELVKAGKAKSLAAGKAQVYRANPELMDAERAERG